MMATETERFSELIYQNIEAAIQRERGIFPFHKLVELIHARHKSGKEPYILLLGSSLSLTPEVRRAICKSDDWGAFWANIQRHSTDELQALIAGPLAELNLTPGYHSLARLAQAGYFNTVLTANIDDALDNALRMTAGEYKVLCRVRTTAEEIRSVLPRSTPRVKVLKLRGDIHAYKLPLSLEEQFEFPAWLEQVVERLLSKDTILVSDIPHDIDIQRCIRRGDGALWVVVPEEPRPGSFLYKAKWARPTGQVITGPKAEFGSFFQKLAEELELRRTMPPNGPSVSFRAQYSTDRPQVRIPFHA